MWRLLGWCMISALVLTSTAQVDEYRCSNYILDLCRDFVGDVITKVKTNSTETCQAMCNIAYGGTCKMWIFDNQLPDAEKCALFSTDPISYINTCMEIAGPIDPTVAECLTEIGVNKCSFFTEGNCAYPNDVLEILPTITQGPGDGESGCDDACRFRNQCEYWRYRYETQECVLYLTGQTRCNIVRGLPSPPISECFTCPQAPCPNGQVCIENENGPNYCEEECNCPVDKPICDDSQSPSVCRECMDDSHCSDPSKPNCDINDSWTCVECVNDADCSGSTPNCNENSNTCVVCVDNEDCPDDKPICDVSNPLAPICRECSQNSDCKDPAKPACDIGDTWQCVECVDDGDCSGSKPNCNADSNTCVVCVDDEDCPDDKPVCDATNPIAPVCRECLQDTDCKDPAKPACDIGDTWQCVECVNDDNCNEAKPTCNTDSNTCVACLNHDDCPEEKPVCDVSDPLHPICRECTQDSDCTDPAKPACDIGDTWQCVECVTDDHCSGMTPNCNEDSNTCVVCVDNEDCPDDKPLCDVSNPIDPICRECLEDSDCKDPAKPACDIGDTWQCVECTNDDDCSGAKPNCNSESNTCVVCVDNEDCPDDKPLCDVTNPMAPICRECLQNSDCKDPAEPACDIGDTWQCVECVNDDDCFDLKPHCNTDSNTCAACVNNDDCPDDKPFCDVNNPIQPICRECLGDSDCTDPNKPVCDTGDTWQCVECVSNLNCSLPEPICRQDDNTCVACIGSGDCPGDKPICDITNPIEPICRECMSNADCKDPTKPVCDLNDSWTCVECVDHGDCTSESEPLCNFEDNTCTDCNCPPEMPFCDAADPYNPVCKECRTDSDCTDPLLPACDNEDTFSCVECMDNADCLAIHGSDWVCNTESHDCRQQGGKVTLQEIIIGTSSCSNCQGSVVVHAQMTGTEFQCTTPALDNGDGMDFNPSDNTVIEGQALGECWLYDFQGNSGNVDAMTVTYRGPGEWIPSMFEFTYSSGYTPNLCENSANQALTDGAQLALTCIKMSMDEFDGESP